MALAFTHWSVDDVKRWVTTWQIHYAVTKQTVSAVVNAADMHHIDGETLIYFTKDDLKQIGLNKHDIDIVIKLINDLVFGTYIDYMNDRYHLIPTTAIHHKRKPKTNQSLNRSNPSSSNRAHPHKSDTVNATKTKKHTTNRQRTSSSKRKANRKNKSKTKHYNPFWTEEFEIGGEEKTAMHSLAQNKNVQNAAYSAMNDTHISNAAKDVYRSGGNDMQSNAKLIGKMAANKNVQRATIDVVKDEKVQKAVKKNATKKNTSKFKSFLGFK